MSLPRTINARSYYRCAIQRYQESVVLLQVGYTTGALYLAGYGIECALKALLLHATPEAERGDLIPFRGHQGHDLEWLRSQYLRTGASLPGHMARLFALVNTWSTEFRYSPKRVPDSEADAFLKATESILEWMKGRF